MKPCPNPDCESTDIETPIENAQYVNCADCLTRGPINDPDGKKWDSLPRRGELTITQTLETITTDDDRKAWREYFMRRYDHYAKEDPWNAIQAAKLDADSMLAAEKSRFDNPTKTT